MKPVLSKSRKLKHLIFEEIFIVIKSHPDPNCFNGARLRYFRLIFKPLFATVFRVSFIDHDKSSKKYKSRGY